MPRSARRDRMSFDRAVLRREVKFLSYPLATRHPGLGNTLKDPVTPLAVAILIAAALFSPAAAADQRAPVVIELFTSQGCSSCPPADAVLGELSERADVLPLSFHVTYWDRLGWPDSFGLEAATARQETYATSLGLRGLYTPQMVIGGRIDVVGSSRSRVLRAIDLLATHREPGSAITVQDGTIRLAGGSQGTATVWLIAFDDAHDVKISRGENAGRTLRYHRVVRDIERLGRWAGVPMQLGLPTARHVASGRDGLAILVQRESDGAILTAARVDLGPG
jgi:hypothetical protein